MAYPPARPRWNIWSYSNLYCVLFHLSLVKVVICTCYNINVTCDDFHQHLTVQIAILPKPGTLNLILVVKYFMKKCRWLGSAWGRWWHPRQGNVHRSLGSLLLQGRIVTIKKMQWRGFLVKKLVVCKGESISFFNCILPGWPSLTPVLLRRLWLVSFLKEAFYCSLVGNALNLALQFIAYKFNAWWILSRVSFPAWHQDVVSSGPTEFLRENSSLSKLWKCDTLPDKNVLPRVG